MKRRFLMLFAAAFFVFGCGSDDATGPGSDAPTCVEGAAAACICAEGPSFGVQVCDSEGSYGPCDCSGTTSPNVVTPSDAGNTGNTGNNGGTDAGDGTDTGTQPTRRNECGGFNVLTNSPGTPCGDCNDGIRVCDGTEGVRCVGASQVNACMGCGKLQGSLDDPCGPCGGGKLECNGSGVLECLGASAPNLCGGCLTLPERPGFFCQENGESGTLACSGPDTLACVGPGDNFCGGSTPLVDVPATPCGQCEDGRFECASPNAIICGNAGSNTNSCGGCGTPLVAEPGTGCGFCGGTWQCDGETQVACSALLNLCGGCNELSQQLGEDCGGGEHAVCDGSNGTECRDAAVFNVCGGRSTLVDPPGSSCGQCGDGKYVCAGGETTACVEDELGINACGGCDVLPNRPGEPCAPGSVWTCDGMNAVTCEFVPDDSQFNACGGNAMLAGQPGTTCEECGTWTCDSLNTDVVFCLGGSPGTLTDENNCGMCGMKCLPGEACVQGACEFDRVVQVVGSYNFYIARTVGGSVLTWGYNDRNGPAGTGSTRQFYYEPVEAAVIDDAIDVAHAPSTAITLYAGTACAVRANNDVWCWGSNAQGQLGVSPGVLSISTLPIKVAGISDVVDIEADSGTICAIKSDRTLWCWGANGDGKLGNGTAGGSSHIPTQVTGLVNSVQDVAVGREAVCASTLVGEVYCWGDDQFGQLGNGDVAGDNPTPTKIAGTVPSVSKIVDSDLFCFAALTAQGVYRWGDCPRETDAYVTRYQTPGQMTGTLDAVDVFMFPTAIVIETTTGEFLFWGDEVGGRSGNLGAGARSTGTQLGTPPGSASIDSVTGTRFASLILMDDGSAYVAGSRADYMGDGQEVSNGFGYVRPEWVPVRTFLPLAVEVGNCRDGFDNDNDGLTDCEDDDCADDIGSVTGTGAISDVLDTTWTAYDTLSCEPGGVRSEKFYRWTAPKSATYALQSGTSVPRLAVEVFDSCLEASPSLACNADDFLNQTGVQTEATFSALAGQVYYFQVSGDGSGALNPNILEVP